MGVMESIFGSSAIKQQLRGKTPEQQQTILYFTGGTGGCLGTKACSDQEYDNLVMSKLSSIGTKEQALKALGIDIDQVNEVEPVRLEGWYYPSDTDKFSARVRAGLDNVLRSSAYRVTWLFFSAEQVFAHQTVFNMDEDSKKSRSEEYFYRDITNFSVMSESTEYEVEIPAGCIGQPTVQRNTRDVDTFGLVVPGDKFRASMTQSEYTQKSIRAMQQKLRDKKSSM